MSEVTSTVSEQSTRPEPVLFRWLEGAGLADLGATEQDLRRELAELQRQVVALERLCTRQQESARQVCEMLGEWAEDAGREAACFGEHDPDPERQGYLRGKGAMCRVYERHLQLIGNVIRSRAIHDLEGL